VPLPGVRRSTLVTWGLPAARGAMIRLVRGQAITVVVGSPGSEGGRAWRTSLLPPGKAQVEDKGTGRRTDLRLSGLRENADKPPRSQTGGSEAPWLPGTGSHAGAG
jgi:hypothetical protein